jgi:ABC-type transport system involved in multi-copper enzyme maturation permease subunit
MSSRGVRGLGPGPVFIYEWVTSTRRWQVYALRSVFVLGLLIALLLMGISAGAARVVSAPAALAALAELGESLFMAVIGTQLTLVLLAAPAATAGAICLDRSRGTLTHLLVTDLTDREIVLGKLAARLTPVLVLIAATLPVMELLTLLGGVDPAALLGAFVVTLGVAVLGSCLALVFSIRVRRTHEALLATYAVWGVFLLGRPMLNELNQATGLSLRPLPWTVDPYLLAYAPYLRPGSWDWRDDVHFFLGTCGISAVLVLLAIVTIRRVGARDAQPGMARRPRHSGASIEPPRSLVSRMLGGAGPTLDFNPVLWREWHRTRPPQWARVVVTLFVAVSVLFSLIAMGRHRMDELRTWVNGFHISFGLLFVSVMAATSMAEERVRGSLDVLLTTPLETWRIVLGKWLGSYRLVPPLVILPVLVVFGAGRSGGERELAAMLMAAFVLCSGAAVTSLGLAMATWCSRLGRALGLTVSLYLLVTVGWIFGVLAIEANPDRLIMGSPFGWAAVVTERLGRDTFEGFPGAAIDWTMLYAWTALVLLAATVKTFNRCLGRVESRSHPRGRGRVRAA